MKYFLLVAVPLFLFSMGCGGRKIVSEKDFVKTVDDGQLPSLSASPQALWAWSYQGERGPGEWSALNPEYSTCSSGESQSPINLIWKKPTKENPLKMNYRPADVIISNTGYTFRMEFTPQSQITYMGQDFILEKAEIRTPSEHRFSGKKLPVEIQFYHRSPNGLRQAIVSLFGVQGKESAWMDSLLKIATLTTKHQASPAQRMDPGELIPQAQTNYHYQGSLTHPPCLEGVDWFVLNTPIQLSPQQIAKLKNLYNNNNRPVQKLNGRKVINY